MRAAAPALLALLLVLPGPARADEKSRQIGVEMDPSLELLGAVQLLAGQDKPPHGYVAHPLDFEKELLTRLAPLKGHEAVRLTAALPQGAFDHMKRGDALVRLTPPPDLAPRYTLPDLFVQDAGGKEPFSAWLAALRDFARASDFGKIFEEERRRLAPAADAFRGELLQRDYIGKIERYTGLPFPGSYTFELTPYFYSGTMVNAVIRLEDGSYVVKTLAGPDKASGETVHYPANVSATAWHELAHGTLDVLGDLMPERVERSRAVYDTLPWHCYNEWHQCVKEYAVRAVMIRLITLNEGEAAGERALRDEGESKWPYLRPMLTRLKEYEAQRDRYPDLGKFYPRLLDVFPRDKEAPPAAAKAGPGAAASPDDPGPEWAMDAAGPFPTDGQRRRALFYLDKLLSGGEDADLRLRRAALELLLREDEAALSDSEAALSRGRAPAPLLARALALRALSRGEEAASDLGAAQELCRRGAGPALACANAARLAPSGGGARTGTAWKEIAAQLASAPAPAGKAAAVTLETDPRLELLSAVWLLGRRAAPDAELPAPVRPYAAEIRRRFAAQASHPAVARLSRLLKDGRPSMAVAQLLMGVTAPPELSPVAVSYGGLGEEQTRAFLEELRDFARASRFSEFYASQKAVYAGWKAAAEKEARGGLRPADAAAYLKTSFARTRFILAPALPSDFDANLAVPGPEGSVELRMRSDMEPGNPGLDFDFNDFAAGVAHELVHTVTDPAGLSRREELQVYSSLAAPRCADSWTGCVLEQVDIAVTLRVLRRERGEAAYEAMLAEYTAAGFPQLRALCERLEEYEAGGAAYPTFDSFYPRLVEVFREALERRVREQARRGLAAPGSASARASGPGGAAARPSADFAVDERVELAAALLAAGKAPSPCLGYCSQLREKFAPFAGHPAVAAARALAEADPSGTLLPRLLLQVSPPPRLLAEGALPADLAARAGGEKAVEDFLAAARRFAEEADFSGFYAAHKADYEAFVRTARAEKERGLAAREAAAYLGGDAPAPLRFLLSAALPAGRAARFTTVGREGVTRVVLRAATYPDGKEPAFGLDAEEGSAAQAAADAVIESMLPTAPASAAPAAEPLRACRDPRAPQWPVCAREVLTRAVVRRIAALSGKASPPAAARSGDALEPLVAAAAARLQEYEAGRERYKALRDFYPRLVEVFTPRAAARTSGAARGAEPRVTFSVDPRVELFSALRLLGGHEAPAPDAAPLPYERAAREWFAPYADDAAVALAAKMTAAEPQRNLPLQLLFHLSPDAKLAAAEPVPEGYAAAAGGPEAVEAWFSAVRAFAKRSRFFEFYASRRADYARFSEQAKEESRRALSVKALPAYLGLDLDSDYEFVLAPLLPQGEATNFTLLGDAGVREIRLRAGTNSDSRGLRFMFDSFGNSAAHELVHTVTNPLAARAPLTGAPPRGCNDSQGPTAWTGCVQEHLVYAVTLRLLAREQGEDAAARVLKEYEGRGFPYLAPLCERLKAYEAARKKWPTLEAFYPQLEAVFRAAPPAGAAALAGDGPGRAAKEEGVKAFLAGRVDEAVARFRAAAAAEPGDVEALSDLGVALEKKGDAAGALDAYDRAVAAGLSRGGSDWEHTAAALSSRATLLASKGREADALKDLEKALELSPSDWSGRAELASRLKAMKGARP